jgi:curved DNA-binding protein CbpA
MADGVDDPYVVLGVARSATQAEIKAAYQALVGKYHPDLHQENPLADLAGERMAEINLAYELLGDPVERGRYDAGFRAWKDGRARPVQAAAAVGSARRTVLTIAAIAALPIVLWVGMLLVRALRLVLVRLFGEAAAIGGGRLAALVVLAGTVVLVVALRKRRPRDRRDGPWTRR